MKSLKWIISKLFKVKVVNEADFSKERIMVVSNYNSMLDGILLKMYLPVDVVFVIQNSALRKWYFRWFLKHTDHILVDIDDSSAMDKVCALLESGKNVAVFPEGKMTGTGKLMKLYNGTAFIASRTQASVIPVWISGTLNSKFSAAHPQPKKLFPNISLYFDKNQTIEIEETEDMDSKRQIANEKMRRVLQNTMFNAQPKETLYSRFCNIVDLYGLHHKVIEDKDHLENKLLKPLTYGDILKRSLILGRVFARHTKIDENVGVLLPNVSIAPCLIVGLNMYKRVPALLNYTIGGKGIQSACETGQIKTLITSRAFLKIGNLEPLVADLKNVRVVYLEDIKKEVTLKDKMWLMLFAMHNYQNFGVAQNPEDPAVLLFTSGSEAAPKGVVLSNRALLANVDQIRTLFDINPKDKVLNAMPLFHSFGLTGGTLLPLLTGTSLVLYPSPLHYKVIPEVSYDRDCTIIFGTNTFLSRYAKHAHPYDFVKMRYVVAGAEKLSEEVRNLWNERFGIRVFEGYGATECAPVIAVNSPIACKFGTVGQFLPSIEYHLKPVEGVEEGGELYVKGPNLMSGYILSSNPGVIKFPESDLGAGWYNTGDIVEVNREGFVKIKGRMKRFIKIAGEMVPLDIVEKIACTASPDHTHAVVIKKEPTESVVLYTSDPELKRDVLSRAAKGLGYTDLMVARDIRYIESIPLLGTGKTDYVTIGKMANE